jgi:SAM-dependent methyltransferase
VSKPPEENESDMEAGMTTAERRRRRRRGGGLRVPSDNVPRRGSSPVVTPSADDPSVAIAYTAGNGEPLDPIAPEAVSTLIDPPGAPPGGGNEEISFESKTREMSAIDLEALGITESETPAEGKPGAEPATASAVPSSVVVDEEMYNEAVEITNSQLVVMTSDTPPPPSHAAPPSAGPPSHAAPPSAGPPSHAAPPSAGPPSHAAPPSAGPPSHVAPPSAARTPLSPAQTGRPAAPSPLSPATPLHPPASAAALAAPVAPPPAPVAPPPGAMSPAPLHAAPPHGAPAPVHGAPHMSPLTAAPALAPHPAPGHVPQAPPASGTAPGHPPPPSPAPNLAAAPAAPTNALSPSAPTRAVESGPAASAEQVALDRELPPPRIKGRAPTLALSEDDLEEFLEENRERTERRREDTADFEVEVDDEASAVPQPVDVGWQSARVAVAVAGAASSAPNAGVAGPAPSGTAVAPTASAAPSWPTAAERDSNDGPPSAETSAERELAAVGDLARTKSSSNPPPNPATTGAAPPATPAARGNPPPAPVRPPPAPPKKLPEKRVTAVAEAAAQEPERKARGKSWFAEVFDEDYLRTLPFLTPQATQAEAELVAASLGTSPGAKLLDVGCGYGRHAMELAARGYHVVGLDLSTPLLVRGGEEAHRRGLTINFIRGDMRELDFDGQFDGAYCLFSTFGYFDDETNKKTAGNLARALRPGGKCVFEILNRDYIIADLPTRVWWEGDGCVVLEEVDFNYFSSRVCVNRSVVFDDGRQLEQEISIRAYSLHEVGKLMLAAGFRVLEVSGSYQTRGRFFGNQSRHIIVVAERA